MHLVLTPDVFALRLNTAIFDCFAVENRKFRATKKPTVVFFSRGCANDAASFEFKFISITNKNSVEFNPILE